MNFSISGELASRAPDQAKCYLWTMASHGVELGFGRAGSYPAHGHLNLVDVMFSAGGLRLPTLDTAGGRLLVAQPGTWFGPVVTHDFWFLKFYLDPARIGVPDKVLEPARLRGTPTPPSLVIAGPGALVQVTGWRAGGAVTGHLRGGATGHLRGGATGQLRGGATEKVRGGATEQLRGGATEQFRILVDDAGTRCTVRVGDRDVWQIAE